MLAVCCILPVSMVNAAEARTREQAVEIALQQNGGNAKVLGVQTTQTQDGRTVFAVKILSNGRVRVFRINKAE